MFLALSEECIGEGRWRKEERREWKMGLACKIKNDSFSKIKEKRK